MTAAVTELYDALRKAGVDEMTAMGAAKAVSGSDLSHLATRADLAELKTELKIDIADMKAEIIKWNTGTLIAATGIFAAIVKLF